MDVLNIGVVGCGASGREHIDRITNKLSGGKIVAVSDVFVEGAHKVGDPIGAMVYNNSADLVNDPDVDAVICTTPGFAHHETVMQALEIQKPIFCEKPLTTSAESSLEIVEAEIAGGKHLVQVGFMRRFDKGIRQIKQLLDSGEFGKPLYVRCQNFDKEAGRNYDTPMAVYDTAIHEIAMLRWLLDDEYESAQIIMPRQTKNTHEDLMDPQLMTLKFRSGVIAVVEVFVNSRIGYEINCQIVCEEGVIDLPRPIAPTYRRAGAMTTPIAQDWKTRFVDAYDTEIQEWINATKRGEVRGPNAWDGLVANVAADALVMSQADGAVKPINPGPIPEFYL